jgi:integrase
MRRRPRGSGTIGKRGGVWFLRVGRGAGSVYETGFRTRGEAEARAALLRAETVHRRLGVAADPRLAPTLAALAGPWLERRKATHAAGAEDASRWRRHLEPVLGHLRPDEVDTALIRAVVETKRAELSPGTLRVVVSILSSFYEDLLERKLASRNPARHLPKSLLRLVRSDHNPETVPFLERLQDVRRVFLALEEPINVAFAIGALAGLRTSEVFKLPWRSVDLNARQILVSEGGRLKGQTKDRAPRPVPILAPLLPVLKEWRLKTGGEGLVIPPLRCDGEKIDKHTPGDRLRKALAAVRLARPGFGLPSPDGEPQKLWYWCTRHSFASHWAMAGRPLRELQKILGHSSLTITERYAHLAPDYWAPGVHDALDVDLSAGGEVVSVAHHVTPTGAGRKPTARNRKEKAGAAL